MPTHECVVDSQGLMFGRYSFGDERSPCPESATLIEEITKQQMEGIVSNYRPVGFFKLAV